MVIVVVIMSGGAWGKQTRLPSTSHKLVIGNAHAKRNYGSWIWHPLGESTGLSTWPFSRKLCPAPPQPPVPLDLECLHPLVILPCPFVLAAISVSPYLNTQARLSSSLPAHGLLSTGSTLRDPFPHRISDVVGVEAKRGHFGPNSRV